jgi:hypothetical protein
MTTMTAPSLSQIKAKVASVQQKLPKARIIGIHSPGRWTEESGSTDDGEFSIYQCDSPLSFRMALRESIPDNATRVLITNLHDHDLGDDILLRLAKRRLLQIDPWQIVRSLFDAQAIDPRLTKHPWIAESLLDSIPLGGFSPARGGFLDAETVWPLLLSGTVGLQGDSPDLTSLLSWSLDAHSMSRFRACTPEFREGAIAWLIENAGSAAEVILHCIERLERADAVAIGLAAGVVYHSQALGKLEKATGILEERYFAGATPNSEDMQRWSATATEVVRTLQSTDATDTKAYRQTVQRGDEILREIKAEEFAHLSDTSPIGFDKRLAQLGVRLSNALDTGPDENPEELLTSHRAVRSHDHATREDRRLQRVDMAMRLVRWLTSELRKSPPEPQSFDEAAQNHLRDGGFIDWARLSLRSGDPVQGLSEAYARLFDRATEMQQQRSRTFAKLLVDWTHAGSQSEEALPVERILDEVVAPLAEKGLVLVIVVDGMSVAVARELLADVTRHEWVAISEPGRQFNRPGLATVPSVTEFSRTSLLCGTLRQGNQNIEAAKFPEHPALMSHSRSGSPPILFHKASLSEDEDTVLAAEVRKEIASTHRRVVGVVVNAVDDHLLKGEQIDTRWTRDEIKVLPALLHEARIARRLVVLVSDHGHMLDCHAVGRVYKDELAGGERWRAAVGEVEDDEFRVAGSRVVPDGHELIAPWSEKVRYGMKKNGYHGGITPQEMVVPIVVLSSTDDLPRNWTEQPIDTPDWWDETSTVTVRKPDPLPDLKPAKPPSGTLFPIDEADASTVVADVQVATWVSRLLACPVFDDQKRLGGRGVPSDEIFTRLLCSLDDRGGKMTSAALARTLEFPAIRLPGLLAKAERVLNVDGYDVLRRDEASDTVELNRNLLLTQFDLVE